MSQALLVGEYLSFRRVATVLGVRQSAVSRRVRELEDELGVSLFERHHAGVRITNAGVRFLQEARAALVQLDQAVKTATAAGSGTIGRISIGILSSIGTGYLRDLLQVYRSRHPEVGIHILESASADNIAAVRKRQLDVAFITDTSEANGCEILPLWSERIFVVLAEHHALCERQEIEWRDLRKQQLIMRESECDQALCDRLNRGLTDRDHGSDVQKLDVGRDTLMHLVAMGLGISLTTEATAATPFPKVVFRPIARNDELLQFSAAWLAHNDNPALRRFLSLARSLANEPRRHPGAALTSRGSAVIGGLFMSLLLPARSREGLVCLHEIGAHRIKSSATLSRSTTASTAATTRRHAHRQLDITGSAWTEAMRRDPIVWSLASLAETARMRGPLT